MTPRKTNPDALFVGVKKDKTGELIDVYFDPNQVQISKQQRRKLLSNLGLSGAGITVGAYSLSKLKQQDSKFIFSEIPTSRRNFLKIGALASGSIGLAACNKKDDPGIIDPADLEAPTPVITGPTELTIPKFGGHIQGVFDSKQSQGTITNLAWVLKRPGTDIEDKLILGQQPLLNYDFTRPGKQVLELIASNSGGSNSVTQDIMVNPPELPGGNYNLPMVLMIRERPGLSRLTGVYLMNENTLELTKLFETDRMHGDKVNWEPNGERILLNLGAETDNDHPYRISTYNLLTGEFKRISPNKDGLAMTPSWSPMGDWVAYTDDSRAPNFSYDEVAIMRPDGSEQFYLSGDVPSNMHNGRSPSWDKDGQRLAVGGGRPSQDINIFKDLFTGSPQLDYTIPTSEQLENLYDNGGFDTSRKDFLNYNAAGPNGLAWSPDGEHIVYDFVLGIIPDNYNLLAMSRADGTGDIEVLAMSRGEDTVDFYLPHTPTWTSDGRKIYFSAFSNGIKRLFSIDPETKQMEAILSSREAYNPSIYD